jgi:hypothetical protein
MEFHEYYFKDDEAKIFVEECRVLMTEDEDIQHLDPVFISKMCNYLEKLFPTYGDFDRRVGNEIRSFVKSDNKQILKVKRKIRDIINKAKEKFLDKVSRNCENITVRTKEVGLTNLNPNPTPNSSPIRGAVHSDV